MFTLIHTSRDLYVKKRDFFQRLCDLHLVKLKDWYLMDREPVEKANGVVCSVYRHTSGKGEDQVCEVEYTLTSLLVPSLDKVYMSLLQSVTSPEDALRAQTVQFLTEGILMEAKQ